MRFGNLPNWYRTRGLAEQNAYGRLRSLERLGAARYGQALGPMIQALNDPVPEVRESAVDALVALGDRSAVRALADALVKTQEWTTREKIVHACEKLEVHAAVVRLRTFLDHEEPAVRQTAAWALRRIGWELVDDEARAKIAIIQNDWSLVAETGDASVPLLGDLVETGTQIQSREAAAALCAVGTDRAFRRLYRTLQDRDAPRGSREVAAWALDRMTWPQLTDEDRALVLVLLGRWHAVVEFGESAIGALEIALGDLRARVRERAISALEAIGSASVVRPLIRAIIDPEQDMTVREAASAALVDNDAPETMGLLVAELAHDCWPVRSAVANTLERMGWSPTTQRESIDHAIATRDWAFLETLGPSALPVLVAALPMPAICWDVARTLVKLGRGGVDALLQTLADPTQPMTLREIVSTVLADSGVSDGVEQLKTWLSGNDPELRVSAASTLEQLGWTPSSAEEVVAVAAATHDWATLRECRAVDTILRLLAEGTSPCECVGAIADLLSAAANELNIAHLRSLAALQPPDATPERRVPELTREIDAVRTRARRELRNRGIMF